MLKLTPSKVNLLLDGQFGSTGKGLFASYIALHNHIDICISNASLNAGHTFYYGDKKIVVKQIPVSGIIHKRSQIFLCAGAILHPKTLLKEMEENNISSDRVMIHPRAAIIEDEDMLYERSLSSSMTKLASTQSGVGRALARKVERSGMIAENSPELSEFVRDFDLHGWLNAGCTAFMEVPQGFDLSLSAGYSYPYCTSRDITVSSALSDCGVHPEYLGKVCVSIRSYPIRVGNIVVDGKEIGRSGPFYPDSVETSWEDLNVKEETTTVTNRVRRVAKFSFLQYQRMVDKLRPDHVLLNFANYLNPIELKELLLKLKEVDYLGFGPYAEDIINREETSNAVN